MSNFENQSGLVLYKCRRIILVYVIQRNIEHRRHFVSNVLVNQDCEATNREREKKPMRCERIIFCEETFCSLSINITKSSHADQRCGTAFTVRTKYDNASFNRPNRLSTRA